MSRYRLVPFLSSKPITSLFLLSDDAAKMCSISCMVCTEMIVARPLDRFQYFGHYFVSSIVHGSGLCWFLVNLIV